METQTTLSAWGTSRAVRIPKKMCEEVEMEIGTTLSLFTYKDERGPYIVVRPKAKAHRSCSSAPYQSIHELFSGYVGEYAGKEFDWGEDVGSEWVQ